MADAPAEERPPDLRPLEPELLTLSLAPIEGAISDTGVLLLVPMVPEVVPEKAALKRLLLTHRSCLHER